MVRNRTRYRNESPLHRFFPVRHLTSLSSLSRCRSLTPYLTAVLGLVVLFWFLEPWFPRPDKVPFGIEGIGQQTVWQSYTFQMIGSLRWEPFAPEILAGYPLLAENEAIPLYPLKSAFLAFPANQALSITWILHFVLLFSGTFLLAYVWTHNTIGALVAGLLSIFTGPILGTAVGGHLSQFAAFSWLPWMAWSWFISFQTHRFSFSLLGAFFLFMSLAAGHPQFSLMAAAGAFLLAVLGTQNSLRLFLARRRLIVFGGLTALFAFFAAGFWLWPLKELLSFSNRAGGFSSGLIDLGSMHIHQLATALVPNLYGNTATSPYTGLLTYEETTCFLGVLPAFLILSTLTRRDSKQKAAWVLVFLGIALSLPFVAVPLARTLDSFPAPFQLPTRWRLIAWFAFALLAGQGVAHYLGGRVHRREVIVTGILIMSLLVCLWVYFFWLKGWESILAEASSEFTQGLRKGVLIGDSLLDPASVKQMRNHSVHSVIMALLLTLFFTLFLCFVTRFEKKKILASAGIVIMMTGSLWIFARPLIRNVSWPLNGWPWAIIEYLKEQPETFRAQSNIPFDWIGNPFPKEYKDGFRNLFRYDKTFQDWGGLTGIESTTGGFSILTRSYQELTGVPGTQWEVPGKIPRRRLNVRYILAPAEFPPEGTDPKPLLVSHGIGLFKDKDALSRVNFFKDWTMAGEPEKPGLPHIISVNGDTEKSLSNQRKATGEVSSQSLPFHRKPGPAYTSVSTFHYPGLVVFSELYYPGFEATVDGKPTNLFLAWKALMAVHVPAGRHEITLQYNPKIWMRGFQLTLFGLLGLVFSSFYAYRQNWKQRK